MAYEIVDDAEAAPVLDGDNSERANGRMPRHRTRRLCLSSVALLLVAAVCCVIFVAAPESHLEVAIASQPRLVELQGLEERGKTRPLTSEDITAAEDVIKEASMFHHLKMIFSLSPLRTGNWQELADYFVDLRKHGRAFAMMMFAYVSNSLTASLMFRYMNFVQGFRVPGFWGGLTWLFSSKEKWKPPVRGETMQVLSYQNFSRQHFGKEFPYAFFNDYYTGNRVPSWEDNGNHKHAVKLLSVGYNAGKTALGQEPMNLIRTMQPRVAFDEKTLKKIAWDGFSWMGPDDIKFASNGFYGDSVVDSLLAKFQTTDALGVLMTDSVFSAHLKHGQDAGGSFFDLDLSSMAKYSPIPGYAPLGGKARFRQLGSRLQTEWLEYNSTQYTGFTDAVSDSDFTNSKLSGWRFAEKAIIASLLAMTNLVMHVKDLHLEIAAAFQAVVVDAFAADPKHPIRRLLDPFVSRSVQATNDNFKLLFDYKAAEFSLAPLPWDEQLRLIDEAIKTKPLNLAEMDMENFGKVRGMPEILSTAGAQVDASTWGWRWHYRALTVQRLYDKMISCWLEAHYGGNTPQLLDAAVQADVTLQGWWASMIQHIPSLARATQLDPGWASSSTLTAATLRNVLRTLMVWLSWIHEDVGHSAAAYVYNPVHTPMSVPEDGVGVPLASWTFNVLAYRGFVFLERAVLLGQPAEFWFDQEKCEGHLWWKKCTQPKDDKKCFLDMQEALRELGTNDPAFTECDKGGFYSCVDRVETAVSS